MGRPLRLGYGCVDGIISSRKAIRKESKDVFGGGISKAFCQIIRRSTVFGSENCVQVRLPISGFFIR
jgi:hypothetical protein